MNAKELIARRIAEELVDGQVINLGFGIPNAAANYIEDDVEVYLQTENGGIIFGGAPTKETLDPDVANSGGGPITLRPGASTFDLATSFSLIRGGHVDQCVLGALEVDQNGNIANWMIPGVLAPGMGGAMDLLVGSKRIIAALMHTDKEGNSKIRKDCTLPLSAANVVDLIITNLAVFKVQEGKLLLEEVAEGVTVEEVIEKTEAEVVVSDNVKQMLA